jgi:hypothetical protein
LVWERKQCKRPEIFGKAQLVAKSLPKRVIPWVLWAAVFLGLYLAKLQSYLLFHSLAEIFSVVVAWSIFAFMWTTRSLGTHRYLEVVGTSYLFVGGIDLVHTLAYKGMGVFPGFDANLPTQLWISARSLETFSFVLASFVLSRKKSIPISPLFLGYAIATGGFLFWILGLRSFPDCFVEGRGLTGFKVAAEYMICAILLGCIVWLKGKRNGLSEEVVRWLTAAMALTIASELSFTLYVDVYGFFNMVGHYLKIASFYMILKAILKTGIQEPFSLVFSELAEAKEELAAEAEELRKALAEVRTLRGLLPICSHCKRVRDDRGYWRQLESYLREHSHVDFTHGVCPECLKRYYPEYADNEPGSPEER